MPRMDVTDLPPGTTRHVMSPEPPIRGFSIVVSLFTEPKPAAELVRLVYSETPKEHLVDPLEKDLPWYRRTVPLGMTVLAITVVLNIIF